MSSDRKFMWQALELAQRGRGYTSPNPLVGCVIAHNGRVVGSGWHKKLGGAHAEIEALDAVGEAARGATMYVTLEPCCHSTQDKRTPPCVPRVIASGIAKAVIAMPDPNPHVNGAGIDALRQAGIDVETGVMGDEARELNAPHVSLMTRQRPWVTVKWAMTLDGKIATRRGDSKWISSDESRRRVHMERGAQDAIMVGIGTVLSDNPLLTARADFGTQPLRIAVDPRLETPLSANLVKTATEWPVLLFTREDADEQKRNDLQSAGVEVLSVAHNSHGHLRWSKMLTELGKRRIASLMIEGGSGLMTSALIYGAADQAMVFIAPKIVGGASAATPVGGTGAATIAGGITLSALKSEVIGRDVMITGKIVYPAKVDADNAHETWPGIRIDDVD